MIGNNGIQSITKGPGYETVNKYGFNLDIDIVTVPETIWSHGGQFPFLDVGIAMDFKSSDAADTLAGTGAQKIEITYYDTNNIKYVEEFNTAGLTRVEFSDDVKIITRVELSQTGSGMVNAGEINFIDRATGLVVYQSIEIGEGQTLSTPQICPAGKKGLVKKHSVTYAKTQNPLGFADMRFQLRKASGAITTKHPIVLNVDNPKDEVDYKIGGIEMAAGDIVYWQCLSVSADNTPIEGRIDIEFEDV